MGGGSEGAALLAKFMEYFEGQAYLNMKLLECLSLLFLLYIPNVKQ